MATLTAPTTSELSFERRLTYTSFALGTRVSQPLDLDCSADLRTYSRNLGPQAQREQNLVPATQAVYDGHSSQENLRSHFRPLDDSARARVQNLYHPNAVIHNRHHSPVPLAPQNLIPNAIATTIATSHQQRRRDSDASPAYSFTVSQALERSRSYETPDGDNVIYNVIEYIANDYDDDESNILGSFRSLRDANLRIAQYSIHEDIDEEQIEVSLAEGGSIELGMDSHESRVSVYVERSWLN